MTKRMWINRNHIIADRNAKGIPGGIIAFYQKPKHVLTIMSTKVKKVYICIKICTLIVMATGFIIVKIWEQVRYL